MCCLVQISRDEVDLPLHNPEYARLSTYPPRIWLTISPLEQDSQLKTICAFKVVGFAEELEFRLTLRTMTAQLNPRPGPRVGMYELLVNCYLQRSGVMAVGSQSRYSYYFAQTKTPSHLDFSFLLTAVTSSVEKQEYSGSATGASMSLTSDSVQVLKPTGEVIRT